VTTSSPSAPLTTGSTRVRRASWAVTVLLCCGAVVSVVYALGRGDQPATVAAPASTTTTTPSATPGFLTILIGRGEWVATTACEPIAGAVPLDRVADELSARGLPATVAVVPSAIEDVRSCDDNFSLRASWGDLAALRDERLRARSVEVRLRYADFQTAAMRRRLPEATDRDEDVLTLVRTLWPLVWQRRVRLRLVGVTLHGLEARSGDGQLDLLATLDVDRHLDEAVDAIRRRHGFGALVRGRAIDLLQQVPSSARGFRLRTPSCSR